MTTLRQAFIEAIRGEEDPEAQADAILGLLALEEDELIVKRDDIASVLNFITEICQFVEGNTTHNWDGGIHPTKSEPVLHLKELIE